MKGVRHGPAAGAALLLALLLAACEGTAPKVKLPARRLYMEAQESVDQALYTEAITKYQQVAEQNPGTLLGSFAYLRLADIYEQQEKWVEAETNYRMFLTANQNTHLTSYVLYRLIQVNHAASFTGLLFPSREVDRDMEPNRQIIREYKRFFFLFPNSVFLDDAREVFRAARRSLAAHEQVVGDFYFEREHYNAAASRYLHLLRNYPRYPQAREVLRRLIEAYRRNQQPELAEEMEAVYRRRFGSPPRPADADSEGQARNAGPAPGGTALALTP